MNITLTKPDDMHVHLRDEGALAYTVPATAKQFSRAIVMPNLKVPVTTVDQAVAYRDRILAHVPKGIEFTPLMTLYLHADLTADHVLKAKTSGIVHGIKLYPKGATTNSAAGVEDVNGFYPLIETMEKVGIPLLIHGEATGAVDIFDREKVFLERSLAPLIRTFPGLRIVLEHITTEDAVEFIRSQASHLAATITAHHLLYNRNDMLSGGIKPHLYCMPLLKREQHRQALLKAAVSGDPRFFLGTDSAPHARHTKESACGCAGVYSAPYAMEIYAKCFEAMNSLDKLEAFASHFGADFYQLPRNTGTLSLAQEPSQVPEHLDYQDDRIIPLCAGEALPFRCIVA